MTHIGKVTLAFLILGPLPSPPLAAQEPEPDQTLMRRDREVAPAVADNLSRVDPERDGWRSEVLHDAAKKKLKAFFHWVPHGGPAPEGLFAPAFSGQALRPDELELLHQDSQLRVSRGAMPGATGLGLDDLEALLGSLPAVLAEPQDANSFFKILSVDLGDDGTFRTAFLWHAAAGTRFPVQVNLSGVATWMIGEGDKVSMIGLTADHYEEVVATRRGFVDVTTGVFAEGDRLWQLLMRHGTDEFAERNDRLIGQSYIGSQGLAVGDVDGDGLDDVYVPMPGGYPNRLYLRRPDGTAQEVSAAAEVDWLDNVRAALILDLDEDGDQDLAMSVGANIVLCWNDGSGRFPERQVLRNVDRADIYSLSAADPDGDGDLDLYACRYVTGGLIGGVPTPYHDADNGASNFYWRNEGGRRFVDATAEVGLDDNNTKFSLASVWFDADDDGDLDLYVANDFGRNNLYINDGGRFRDEAVQRGADDLGAAMGASVADVDHDGDLDILVTNMFSSAGRRIATQADRFMEGEQKEVHADYVRHARGNSLLLNDGGGVFTDATEASGLEVGGWAWGARFIDVDNDGRDDVYSPNGFLTNRDEDDL